MAYSVVRFVEDLIVISCPTRKIKQTDDDDLVKAPYNGKYYVAVILGQGDQNEMTELLTKTIRVDKIISNYQQDFKPDDIEGGQSTFKKNKFVQTCSPSTSEKHTQTHIDERNLSGEDGRVKRKLFATSSPHNTKQKNRENEQPLYEPVPSTSAMKPSTDSENEDLVLEDDEPTFETPTFSEVVEPKDEVIRGRKRYFCIFCKNLVINFARHIENNHKEEEEVLQLLSTTKNSKERYEILNAIRGRGTLFYNTSYNVNKGNIIVRRRNFRGKKLSGFTACPKCNNYYRRTTLYRHFRICGSVKETAPRNLQTLSESISMPIEIKLQASEKMKKEILPGMKKDKVNDFIQNDPWIINYGNYLCVRHKSEKHLNNMIRTKLRQIANLVIIMKSINPEIKSLDIALRPNNFDCFMEAVNQAAGFQDGIFRAPSLVSALGSAMKLCAQRLRVHYIKTENEDLKRKTDKWLQVYDHEFYFGLGKTALTEVVKTKWGKPQLLPLTSDILKLNNYLNEKATTAYTNLKKKIPT